MDASRLKEIAEMCKEAIDLVPNNRNEQEKNVSTMFSRLRAIAVVCMENLDLSPELKRIIPIKRQGELYDAVRSIHGTNSFGLDKAASIRGRLSRIEEIVSEAAIDLDPKNRLERGAGSTTEYRGVILEVI